MRVVVPAVDEPVAGRARPARGVGAAGFVGCHVLGAFTSACSAGSGFVGSACHTAPVGRARRGPRARTGRAGRRVLGPTVHVAPVIEVVRREPVAPAAGRGRAGRGQSVALAHAVRVERAHDEHDVVAVALASRRGSSSLSLPWNVRLRSCRSAGCARADRVEPREVRRERAPGLVGRGPVARACTRTSRSRGTPRCPGARRRARTARSPA